MKPMPSWFVGLPFCVALSCLLGGVAASYKARYPAADEPLSRSRSLPRRRPFAPPARGQPSGPTAARLGSASTDAAPHLAFDSSRVRKIEPRSFKA